MHIVSYSLVVAYGPARCPLETPLHPWVPLLLGRFLNIMLYQISCYYSILDINLSLKYITSHNISQWKKSPLQATYIIFITSVQIRLNSVNFIVFSFTDCTGSQLTSVDHYCHLGVFTVTTTIRSELYRAAQSVQMKVIVKVSAYCLQLASLIQLRRLKRAGCNTTVIAIRGSHGAMFGTAASS